jgi:hypothetical protein
MKATLLFKAFLVFLLIPIGTFNQTKAQTFSPKTDFASASSPHCSVTGDFNGDGKQDVATGSYTSNVSVFLNTTNPGALTPAFSPKSEFDVWFGTEGISACDFNGDGKLDIITSCNGSFCILLNLTITGASSPTFSKYTGFTTSQNAHSVAISDFNNDGLPDVAITNTYFSFVSVFLNTTIPGEMTPTVSLQTDFSTGQSPYFVTASDLNNDGKKDLAVVNANSNSLSIMFNTTSPGASVPSFSAKTDFATGGVPASVAVADLNLDGKQDLAVTNFNGNTIAVFLNITSPGALTPSLSPKTLISNITNPQSVKLEDINGDGKPDILATNIVTNSVSVYLNAISPGGTTPAFAPRETFATGTNPFSVSVADFNGDGKQDLVLANGNSDNISILLNTTAMGVTPEFSNGTDFDSEMGGELVLSDINLDGKLDILYPNPVTSLSVFLNTSSIGGSIPDFSTVTNFGIPSELHLQIKMADINLDGKPDILTSSHFQSTLCVLINTTAPGASSPAFSSQTNFSSIEYPEFINAADINGDGKPDVIAASRYSTIISIFINTTSPGSSIPTFASTTLDIGGTGFLGNSKIKDLNGDGKPDLAIVNGSSISILMNSTFPGAITPAFTTAGEVASLGSFRFDFGDFNGDGKPDIVISRLVEEMVQVCLNTTVPGAVSFTFSSLDDYSIGTRVFNICAKDINSDGKCDIVSANGWEDASILVNNTLPGSSSSSFSVILNEDYSDGICNSVSIEDINMDGKQDIVKGYDIQTFFSVKLNTSDLSSPLPVELASFTSAVNGNNVMLNWNTVMEENNSGFEIERNSFGAEWNKIGFLAGKGTTNTPQSYSFADNGLNTGRYSYRLKQIDYNGNYKYYELQNEVVIGVPVKFALMQNYPNPFNPSTIINYQLAINSFVSLKIYDISGREVKQLVNTIQPAGYYTVSFDAKNLSSGMYFYSLKAGEYSSVKKMVLVK